MPKFAVSAGLKYAVSVKRLIITLFVMIAIGLQGSPAWSSVMLNRGTDVAVHPLSGHCHDGNKHAPTGTHEPGSHDCCADSGCACALTTVVIAPVTPSLTNLSCQSLVISIAAPATFPPGLRSPLFRPPIS